MHIYIMGTSGDMDLFVRTICAASILLITKIAALVLNTINLVIYSSLATEIGNTNPVCLIANFVITGIIEVLLILEVIFDVFLFIGLYKKKMVAYKVFRPSVMCYIFEAIVYVYVEPMFIFQFPVNPFMALDIFLLIVNVAQIESPVRYEDHTHEEWNILNEIYDISNAEDQLHLNDTDIILDSDDCTPVPSPSSVQDFNENEGLFGTDIPSINSLISVSENENIASDRSIIKKRKPTYKNDPGRKRKRHVDKWIDVRRKLLVNSGKQYTSRKGKTVAPKKLKLPCSLTCKLKCSTNFTENIRNTIFEEFWQLCDHNKQWEYINKFSKKAEKRRMTTEGPSRRKFTTKYYLPLPGIDSSTFKSQQVCLKMFSGTLSITDQMIRSAHQKLSSSGVTGSDNRGKHTNHLVKKDEEMIKSVCDHVKSFQPVDSHYTRKSSNKLYLDNSLTFNKMFSMYREWSELDKFKNTAQTVRQYQNIVNEHMNLSFFMPKKDMCDKCHCFANETNPSEAQILAHNNHITNKETARKYKAKDKDEATQKTPSLVCATYDFQKLLNCPSGEVSLFYYKRKLSLMNFTVFDAGKKEGFCYLWTENVAKRGANEVSSCLLDFIQKKAANGAKEIRFWSDNCTGQNRNRVVYSLYMLSSKKYDIDITHRFLESGHTQQEADSVHALIERSAKGKVIYSPDQWYALIRWAKNNDPYNLIEVTQDLIYDFKCLLENRNFKKNTLNQDVKWNNIKEIFVSKSEPNVILYKYDLESEYLTLNTLVQTRRNKKTVAANCNYELKQLYSKSLPISNAKYNDLMQLCKAGHIPKQYHDFFQRLLNTTNENNSSESDDND